MDRRHFLRAGMGGGALSLMAARAGATSPFDALAGVEPIRASVDRIFRTTVCLRPFRAAGPRIEVEQVGRKRVVHNSKPNPFSMYRSASATLAISAGVGERK